jgi:hypothetical protein
MIFQGFIDDSSKNNEFFVLGGHVASVETWVKFAAD